MKLSLALSGLIKTPEPTKPMIHNRTLHLGAEPDLLPEFVLELQHEQGMAHVDVKLFSVGSWEFDGTIVNKESVVHGTVKGDGCSHMYFGDQGYLHHCGDLPWTARALITLQVEAFRLMHDHGCYLPDGVVEEEDAMPSVVVTP